MNNRQKWRLGVVLGALGEDSGGIWAPRRSKAEKKLENDTSLTPPRGPVGSQNLEKK